MPHTRRDDQSVDAFSLPKELLKKAKKRAVELRMTKSGFYRYCLAKFLGYTEDDARRLAEHRAVLNSVESAISKSRVPEGNFVLNESSSITPSEGEEILDEAAAAARRRSLKYKPKR